MEIKYDAVFGPQELFDCASDDAVLAIKDTTSGRIHIFTNDGLIKSGLKHERHIGTSDNQIAMRSIIKTQVIGYDESDFEDELEALYWHFDTDKKTGARSERDIFKGKVSYLINKFTQQKKTPVWTVADQKAGKLPEVGCKCIWVDKSGEPGPEGMKYPKNGCEVEIIAHCENYNNTVAVFKFKTEEGMYVAVSMYVDDFKPIESPEEKAARLKSEWCAKAAKQLKNLEYTSTLTSIYDALLSGELPMPKKGGE